MGVLDDAAIFAAVIEHGGFSHAAKMLGFSNGMVSRRIAQLEKNLGVSLLNRTTRQLQLTAEGEIFLTHVQRMKLEYQCAIEAITDTSLKGCIKVSAPPYLGRNYLTPIFLKFLNQYPDIKIELIISDNKFDVVKEKFDIAFRGAGFMRLGMNLEDSSLRMKVIYKEKIGLYASSKYLKKYGEPKNVSDLASHHLIDLSNSRKTNEWNYETKNKLHKINITPKLSTNDIEANLYACEQGFGISKFNELTVRKSLQSKLLTSVLGNYNWGAYHLYAVYPQQIKLPLRTRILLDFIKQDFK